MWRNMVSIKRINMNKNLILLLLLMISSTSFADVKVTITDGPDNAAVVGKMEMAISGLLTEINNAQKAKRDLNFSNLYISTRAQESMSMLWENSPFECTDEEIVERCLATSSGYQIRNIPLMMRPNDNVAFNEEEYQEGVVSFSKNGEIESFYLSISMNLYMNVIKANKEITDLRRRQLILDYVEHFRTSYNQKDLQFLNQIFSDDALIITGRVIQQKTGDGISLPSKILYKKHTKQEYLNKLKVVFAKTKHIKVTFDEIEVLRHPVNADFYGVTLHQGYTTDFYHDDGYLFLLWDFTDESAPKIHVRTWQPDRINGGRLPKDEIFNLNDFDI